MPADRRALALIIRGESDRYPKFGRARRVLRCVALKLCHQCPLSDVKRNHNEMPKCPLLTQSRHGLTDRMKRLVAGLLLCRHYLCRC
jgi:hypothetical protein